MPEKNDFPAEFYHMAGRECLRRAVREFDADPTQVPESLGWFMKCCDVIHPDSEQEFSTSTHTWSESSEYSPAPESNSSDTAVESFSSDENPLNSIPPDKAGLHYLSVAFLMTSLPRLASTSTTLISK